MTLDPEEVRRALDQLALYEQAPCAERTVIAAAREWLRLREQPAPCDVPDCGGTAITHLCGEHGSLTVEAVEQREQHLLDTIVKMGKEIERLEAVPREQPAPVMQHHRPICTGCGKEIDPECCGCGSPMHGHDMHEGHSPVPMGCDCYRHEPAADVQAQIDAAVARERERIIELVELKRAKFNIGTRASLALNDVLDQIRARSAKGV